MNQVKCSLAIVSVFLMEICTVDTPVAYKSTARNRERQCYCLGVAAITA